MIKQLNRLLLLHYVAVYGSLQTREMSRLLQLSRTATINMQAEMLDANLLSRTGTNDVVGYRYELTLGGAHTLIRYAELLKPYGSYSSFESPCSTLLADVQRRASGASQLVPPHAASPLFFAQDEQLLGVQDSDVAE